RMSCSCRSPDSRRPRARSSGGAARAAGGCRRSPMEAFEVLGDPVRRRILELLAEGEGAAGDVGATVQAEFRLTQPAVSRHLRVLRESGFARMRPEGQRRLYAIDPAGLEHAEGWLADLRAQWS